MDRYTIPILLSIVSIGIFFGVIRGSYARIEQGIKQKEEITGYLEEARKAKSKLDQLTSTISGFPGDAEHRLDVLLPRTKDEVLFLMELQELAKKSGMQFEDVSATMGKAEAGGGYAVHKMNFTINASYPEFRTFLRVMEKSLALRDAGSIGISSKRKGGATADGASRLTAHRADPTRDQYQYTISINSYSLQ